MRLYIDFLYLNISWHAAELKKTNVCLRRKAFPVSITTTAHHNFLKPFM